jgi:hypothetical protein
MTVDEVPEYLKQHELEIGEQLRRTRSISLPQLWLRRLRLTCAAGSGISATVKRLRCCADLKRGYAVDFGRRCGSNGSRDERDFTNFANGM